MSVYDITATEICRGQLVARVIAEAMSAASQVTRKAFLLKTGARFDFEEGPEGAAHVHPHEVFHSDCRRAYFPALDHH